MAADIWYTIKNNRYKSGYIKGLTLNDAGELRPDGTTARHTVFLRALDGIQPGSLWGRASMRFERKDEEIFYLYAAAVDDPIITTDRGESASVDDLLTDPSVNESNKFRLLEQLGAIRFVNSEEMLLYSLKGRYLYLAVEITGDSDTVLKSLRISTMGDNFMAAFPEIYRERNGFLHRYLSIFSTIYNDIGADGDGLYRLLDADSCPAELLEMYAGWFGIDIRGGFLDEDTMRSIVKEAYSLNRMKGTRRAIERILEILLGEKPILIERSIAERHEDPENTNEVHKACTDENYEVTVLVNTRLTEERRHQLMWLIDQFKPLRTRLRLVQLERDAVMDGNSYLDMNAAIPGNRYPVLEEGTIYDGAMTLQ